MIYQSWKKKKWKIFTKINIMERIELDNNSFLNKEEILGKKFQRWIITNDGNICIRKWKENNIEFILELTFPIKFMEKYNRVFKLEKEMLNYLMDLKLTKITVEIFKMK